MSKIKVEIDEKYREALDLLKQVIPDMEGGEIKDDSKMVEALIDSFMAFIQEQAAAHSHEHEHEHWEWGCCWGGSCWTHK